MTHIKMASRGHMQYMYWAYLQIDRSIDGPGEQRTSNQFGQLYIGHCMYKIRTEESPRRFACITLSNDNELAASWSVDSVSTHTQKVQRRQLYRVPVLFSEPRIIK